MDFHLLSKSNSWVKLHFIWILAQDQEEEEEEEEDEGDEEDEEEDEEEEDDDNEEDEDDEKGEEKSLQKMEKQRSQGKVRAFEAVSSPLLSFALFLLIFVAFSVFASQSHPRKNEDWRSGTSGARGKSRGKTIGHHDDEEEREVSLQQNHVRKEEKDSRGWFHFAIDLNAVFFPDNTAVLSTFAVLTLDSFFSLSDILSEPDNVQRYSAALKCRVNLCSA